MNIFIISFFLMRLYIHNFNSFLRKIFYKILKSRLSKLNDEKL